MRCVASYCFYSIILFIPFNGYAQVDPFWLRSWEQAQTTRPDQLAARSRIAAKNEPGLPLVIHGKVVMPDGKTSASSVVVHAYHRDNDGFDFGPGENNYPVWRLQGWAKTDESGYFEFQTIKPAPDHLGREGAHIHFTLQSVDYGNQWAPTIFFADDQLVTNEQRRKSRKDGEFGQVRQLTRSEDQAYITVKIRLKNKADF